MTLFFLVLSAILIVILFPYLVGPIAVRFQQFFRSDAPVLRLEFEDLPADAQEYFTLVGREMKTLGFDSAGFFVQREHCPNMTSYYWLLANQTNGDRAAAMDTRIENGANKMRKTVLEFCTEFVSGEKICTSTNDEPTILKLPARLKLFNLPANQSTLLAYEVHRQQLQKSGVKSAILHPTAGREEFYITASADEIFQTQVREGLYFVDRAAGVYRPTMLGACLMTWKLLPPLKNISQAAAKQQADRMIRQLNA